MYDAFIAYASNDEPKARQFRALLESLGYTAFLDADCIDPGEIWESAIEKALHSALVTFLLISRASGSAYYQNEERLRAVGQVRHSGHRLVPVYLMGREEAATLGVQTQQLQGLYWESHSLGPVAAKVDRAMKASVQQRSEVGMINEKTVLIVTGCDITPELFDRPNAYRLKEAIDWNTKASCKTFLKATVMGDLWFFDYHASHPNVISLGGPSVNKLSRIISERGTVMRHHSAEKWHIMQVERRWAIFGGEASETSEALDAFRHSLLSGYLDQIWSMR
ncbi:MAG TPA: toll/interleukin-1 receptor domain-containing protein [Chthoniobacteraceae bacterium]|jgi:hypothetical protein|nr:toll/interleukin-1 receptor domain-containing protein [Chthoniobacteraceae bacterium]